MPWKIEDIPPTLINELMEACNRVGNNRASGLDEIPNIALKTAIKASPSLFLDAYDIYFREGTSPRKWKQQRLVRLANRKKATRRLCREGDMIRVSSSYRPLGMLERVRF